MKKDDVLSTIEIPPKCVQILGYSWYFADNKVHSKIFKQVHIRSTQRELDNLKRLFVLKHKDKVTLILRQKGTKFKQ